MTVMSGGQPVAVNPANELFATLSVAGLTGATAPSRWVGGTTGGPPTSGTFDARDFVIDPSGTTWTCTVGGTPGTWTPAGAAIMAPQPSGDTTGVTDTAAVQAAVDLAWRYRCYLTIMQPGVYYISQLLLRHSTRLWGSGEGATGADPTTGLVNGTIVRAPLGNTTHMFAPDPGPSFISRPELAYFTIDGNNGTSFTAPTQTPNAFDAIHFATQVVNFRFHNLQILNVPNNGIYLGGNVSYGGSHIYEVQVGNAYQYGIQQDVNASDVHYTDIEVNQAGQHCFVVNGVQGTWLGCKSNGAGQLNLGAGTADGWHVTGSSHVLAACVSENDHGTSMPFTATNASPCVFTATVTPTGGTGYTTSTQVVLTGANVPSGFTAGAVYWVVSPTSTTFQLATTQNGTAINSSSTGSGSVNATSAANANAFYVNGSHNLISGTASGASNALVYLDSSASQNEIDLLGNTQTNWVNPSSVYQINGTPTRNRVRLKGNPTVLTSYAQVSAGAETGNAFDCEQESAIARQTISYNASGITPDPYLGGHIKVGTLTGALPIANPANGHAGSRITFQLTQNSAGGNAVSWGSAYTLLSSLPTLPNSTITITFAFDGTTWTEVGIDIGGVPPGGRSFKQTSASASSGSPTTSNGTPVTLSPDTGYAGFLVTGVWMVTSGVVSETITGTITATFDDTTTASATVTATSNTTTNLAAGNSVGQLVKDGRYVTGISATIHSSITGSSATATFTAMGTSVT